MSNSSSLSHRSVPQQSLPQQDLSLCTGLPVASASRQLATRAVVRNAPRALKGMSLLEIMVVITLIGLVTATVGVAVMNSLESGQIDTARNQANEIGKSIDIYKLSQGSFPSTSQGLTALTSPPKGKPLMDRVPQDPWGSEYVYTNPGQKNPKSFDIRSLGPDRTEGTEDDIGNWPEE